MVQGELSPHPLTGWPVHQLPQQVTLQVYSKAVLWIRPIFYQIRIRPLKKPDLDPAPYKFCANCLQQEIFPLKISYKIYL
jgi:hypothetical protein